MVCKFKSCTIIRYPPVVLITKRLSSGDIRHRIKPAELMIIGQLHIRISYNIVILTRIILLTRSVKYLVIRIRMGSSTAIDVPRINGSVQARGHNQVILAGIFYVFHPTAVSVQGEDPRLGIPNIPNGDRTVIGARRKDPIVEEPSNATHKTVLLIQYTGHFALPHCWHLSFRSLDRHCTGQSAQCSLT